MPEEVKSLSEERLAEISRECDCDTCLAVRRLLAEVYATTHAKCAGDIAFLRRIVKEQPEMGELAQAELDKLREWVRQGISDIHDIAIRFDALPAAPQLDAACRDATDKLEAALSHLPTAPGPKETK